MDLVNLFAHLGVRLCRISGNESQSHYLMNTLHVTIECRKYETSSDQLPASEMLCNEGRQDFDLIAAAEFIDGVLADRCLSCFIT